MPASTPVKSESPEALYLDFMKKCLTRYVFGGPYAAVRPRRRGLWRFLYPPLRRLLAAGGFEMVRRVEFDPSARAEGRDWPWEAETMIGLKRLDNLQTCVTDVLERGVPGDLIEAGVWRGGAAIFMRAVLKVYRDTARAVWAADSFQGLPRPDPERYPADEGDRHWTYPALSVSLEDVKANFARYGLLDDQVRFLVGWFKDTLPGAPIERLAVLRVDADMYESTIQALEALHPKLSVGGYVIVDDYGAVEACRKAVDDFRTEHSITADLVPIDWTGVYWRRER